VSWNSFEIYMCIWYISVRMMICWGCRLSLNRGGWDTFCGLWRALNGLKRITQIISKMQMVSHYAVLFLSNEIISLK